MPRLIFLSFALLSACAAPPPQLEDRISAEARAQDFPELIPLAPFADIDALLPPDRDDIALSLQARAASLRSRASALQALPLN